MIDRVISFLSVAYLSQLCLAQDASRPNIVMILMDDIGWDDFSFNGGQIPTPKMDALRKESILLTKHYVHLMCSPSRTQFLTGRYAMYQGIGKMLPWDDQEIGGIPMGQPTLANWLKLTANYKTYAVGKWHMGYAYDGLLPNSRGFDHFYGFYQGAVDYVTLKYKDIEFGETDHYDFWEDMEPFCDIEQVVADDQVNSMDLYRAKTIEYINDAGRDPSQPFYMYLALQTMHVPFSSIEKYQIECLSLLGKDGERTRRYYCQNLLWTDDVVGAIIKELKDSGNWDNTLLVFTADNGGDIEFGGCNYPFRGTKGTMFDGNTRTVAFVGGGAIPTAFHNTQREALFSSLDWTPTFLEFAGVLDDIAEDDRLWDGRSQYELLMAEEKETYANKRDHIVLNIGSRDLTSASVVFEDQRSGHLYKYIAENAEIDHWKYNKIDGWCVPDENNNWNLVLDTGADMVSSSKDDQYLFDLTNDVSEMSNLLKADPDTAQGLVHQALQLIEPYAEHPLYHSPLDFLWDRQPEGDPALLGDGAFVAPFLGESAYFALVQKGLDSIDEESIVPSQSVRDLYLNKWTPPIVGAQKEKMQSKKLVASTAAYNVVGISQNVAMIMIVSAIVLTMFLFRWCTRGSRKDYTLIPTSSDSVVHV